MHKPGVTISDWGKFPFEWNVLFIFQPFLCAGKVHRFIEMTVYVREKKGSVVTYKENGTQTDYVINYKELRVSYLNEKKKHKINLLWPLEVTFPLRAIHMVFQLGLPKEFWKWNYYIGNANTAARDSGGPAYQIKSKSSLV